MYLYLVYTKYKYILQVCKIFEVYLYLVYTKTVDSVFRAL